MKSVNPLTSSVRRILKREGGRNFRKFDIRMKIVSPIISPIFCSKLGEKKFLLNFSPIFCPKLGEDQKKQIKNNKKGLQSNLIRFFAQIR